MLQITDEDVKDCPTFAQVAKSLHAIFADCDIAGYNSNKFDVPLLIEEFGRAGLNFDVAGRNFIDVQNIFHKMEQRTLIAAYKFYCGKNLEEAHSALADTRATYEVLLGQLDRYGELQNDVAFLSDFSKAGRAVDLAARVVLDDQDQPVFNFGKHKGKRVKDVFRREPSFYHWMMQSERKAYSAWHKRGDRGLSGGVSPPSFSEARRRGAGSDHPGGKGVHHSGDTVGAERAAGG